MPRILPLIAAATLCVSVSATAGVDQARDALHERVATLSLTPGDLQEMELTDQYTSRHTGVEHIWFRQIVDGLPVALGLANVNLGADGKVWSVHSRFVADAQNRAGSTQPSLSPLQALAAYASERRLDFSLSPVPVRSTSQRQWIYSGGSMADREIPVNLAWLAHDGELRLVWDVAVDEAGRPDWFNAFIDAHTGEVLQAVNWTRDAAYRVIPEPQEHPGLGPDELVVDPEDPDASPLGWHDTGTESHTDTQGNNVFAQEDTDGNNFGGHRPDGGDTLVFHFPLDLTTQNPSEYQDFAITNLFYWNNVVHDVLWHHGFDEAAGNFQQSNLGNGGLGNDAVRADAQDGSGTNNANFSTPPDGTPPRMQMFVWTSPDTGLLEIEAPASVAGEYSAAPAAFGAPLAADDPFDAITLVDDGSGNPSEGCNALTGFPAGNLAMVDRGGCEFGLKALNAENAGASGVIVVNNEPGNGTLAMGAGAVGNQVTIAAAMIGNDDGLTLKAELDNGLTGRLLDNAADSLNRDSDLDSGVIAHEYAHGLSNRLTGGPSTTSCLFGSQQAGEGWSDFLALWITARPEDSAETLRGMGSYLIFQEDVPGAGIRVAPYTRDMAVNSLDYEDVGGVSVPHGVGTVFATALWDMYWNLVQDHGFDPDFRRGSGGNNMALRLVIDGLKLQPCGPTFLDARDAILLADEISHDGANQCAIWEAFARRGMGVAAQDGGGSGSLNVTNDFEAPEACTTDVLFADDFEAAD